MSTPSLEDLLLPGGLRSNLFPPNSRYSGMDTNTYVSPPTPEEPEGKNIIYLQRRFLPPADRFALLHEHIVTEGERVDNITATFLGDPEQYWRICDANNVMHPRECEEIGRRLRITLPEGIPGTTDA
jgi:hypothetical protein